MPTTDSSRDEGDAFPSIGTTVHAEQFVHLVDLAHDRALIAWGAFYFARDAAGTRWRVVEDARLPDVAGRRTCIGAGAEPFGAATVEVSEAATGQVVRHVSTTDRTWVWVDGLEPDTDYRYRVLVDGREWGLEQRLDWVPTARGGYDLAPAGRAYRLQFRTWPHPDRPTPPMRFVAIGDFGVGVGSDSESSRRQRRIAAVLERLVLDHDVRFVVSLGDTVYQGGREPRLHGGNGDGDEDWYPSFFQPYRDVITRVPVFPAIGNHDTDDDGSDNREQMEDNFHIRERFRDGTERASTGPGLFYRLSFGRDLQLVCVDTSVDSQPDGAHRFFQEPRHHAWLRTALAENSARWVVPFSHHPAFCAGPHHGNDEEIQQSLLPLFDQAGVRLVLAGHEHNFQVNEVDGRTYVISGAGGKVQEGETTAPDAAGNRAWAAQAHLLLIEVDGAEIRLTPIAGLLDDGSLHLMTALTPGNDVVEPPFVVSRPE